MISLAAVSYLNAKPILWGLDAIPGLSLFLDVPSALIGHVQSARVQAALLPVIDYHKVLGLRLLPVSGIGCNGPTLTVRIFSPHPIDRMTQLAVDPDSHTSVALARVILKHRLSHPVEFLAMSAQTPSHIPRLLIGDKVITNAPANMPHQLDLGAAWKDLTGKPFVFAAWFVTDKADVHAIATHLIHAKKQGRLAIDQILSQHAKPMGWPADIARQYLCDYLKYDIGPAQIDAVRSFYQMAHEAGVIPQNRPLEVVDLTSQPACAD